MQRTTPSRRELDLLMRVAERLGGSDARCDPVMPRPVKSDFHLAMKPATPPGNSSETLIVRCLGSVPTVLGGGRSRRCAFVYSHGTTTPTMRSCTSAIGVSTFHAVRHQLVRPHARKRPLHPDDQR